MVRLFCERDQPGSVIVYSLELSGACSGLGHIYDTKGL